MEAESEIYDPYAMPPSEIREPPTTLWAALKQIGPGIILAGTIVGSGELVLTTAIGARHGFVFLWLILFSCVIKVFVQVELGRYAISSGLPTLGALQKVSSMRWIGNALLLWWFAMMLCTVFQLGGMTGGVGQSLNMAIPQLSQACTRLLAVVSDNASEYLLRRTELPWAVVTCLVTIALIYRGSYRRIESLTTLLVVSVTIATVVAALALQLTVFSPKYSEVLKGLIPTIPPEGIAEAFAVFGITGVGATELFYYPYWCLEKGYARYTGRNDGTAEWEARARGWIRVMHLDAWVSMVVFTLSTLGFYFLGAAVLHPQNLVPQGSEMIATLSEMYNGPFGSWTQTLFLIGAGTVLFKTLYLACAANSRMTVDLLGLFGIATLNSASGRIRGIRFFCILFPILALGFYINQRDPQLMVRLGGMAQAATLPMMACATIYFRYYKVEPSIRPGLISDLFLWIAVISIVLVAAYSVPDSLSKLLESARVRS